ncbi:L-rhamnose mutarotase [Pseudomonas sp. MT3]
MSQRHCLALDLADDPQLIAQYRQAHQCIWPEVAANLRANGVLDMQIWQLGTRLFMVMEVSERFSFQALDQASANSPRIQEWETLMWRYQRSTPWNAPGQKWVPMDCIFSLAEQPQAPP